ACARRRPAFARTASRRAVRASRARSPENHREGWHVAGPNSAAREMQVAEIWERDQSPVAADRRARLCENCPRPGQYAEALRAGTSRAPERDRSPGRSRLDDT